MKLTSLKTITTKTATVVGAVVITAVVVSGTLSVAQAAGDAVAENVPNNSVNTAKIVNDSILSIDIKNNTVASVDILDNTVGGADITNGGVTSFEIADGNVGPADLNNVVKPRWAHVDGGATVGLLDERGVTSAAHGTTTGVYVVTFDDSIVNCGMTATRTDNADGSANPGFITVERLNDLSSPRVVWVRTFNTAGVPADTVESHGFTIRADC